MSLSVIARNDLASSKFLEITVKNTGDSNCHTRNPMHSNGLLQENGIQVTDANGQHARYLGPLLSTTAHDTTLLNPGQEFSFVVSLSDSYLLEAEKNYTAKYSAYCEENPQEVVESKTVTVVGKDRGISLDAAEEIPLEDRQVVGFEKLNYLSNGLTSSRYKFLNFNDQGTADEIATATDKGLENLRNITKFRTEKFLSHYNKFICEPASNGKTEFEKQINSTFTKSIDFLDSDDIAFIYRGKYCRPSTNAYVYPAEILKNIYICDNFVKNLPALPTTDAPYSTKLGTITHEVTHKVNPCVVDYYYPMQHCTDHIKKSNCTSTQAIIDTLRGDCRQDPIENYMSQQVPRQTRHNVNVNMYNANCLRFMAEDAYEKAPGSNRLSAYSIAAATGVALALGIGYWQYRRHA